MNSKLTKKLRKYTKKTASENFNEIIETMEQLPFIARFKLCMKILTKKL